MKYEASHDAKWRALHVDLYDMLASLTDDGPEDVDDFGALTYELRERLDVLSDAINKHWVETRAGYWVVDYKHKRRLRESVRSDFEQYVKDMEE